MIAGLLHANQQGAVCHTDIIAILSELVATEEHRPRSPNQLSRQFGTKSVIHEALPAESIELKPYNDPEHNWKLGEAATVPVASIFQFLRCEMHRSTADRIEEIVLLFALFATESSPPRGFFMGVIA